MNNVNAANVDEAVFANSKDVANTEKSFLPCIFCKIPISTKASLKRHYLRKHKKIPAEFYYCKDIKKDKKLCAFCHKPQANISRHIRFCANVPPKFAKVTKSVKKGRQTKTSRKAKEDPQAASKCQDDASASKCHQEEYDIEMDFRKWLSKGNQHSKETIDTYLRVLKEYLRFTGYETLSIQNVSMGLSSEESMCRFFVKSDSVSSRIKLNTVLNVVHDFLLKELNLEVNQFHLADFELPAIIPTIEKTMEFYYFSAKRTELCQFLTGQSEINPSFQKGNARIGAMDMRSFLMGEILIWTKDRRFLTKFTYNDYMKFCTKEGFEYESFNKTYSIPSALAIMMLKYARKFRPMIIGNTNGTFGFFCENIHGKIVSLKQTTKFIEQALPLPFNISVHDLERQQFKPYIIPQPLDMENPHPRVKNGVIIYPEYDEVTLVVHMQAREPLFDP